MVSLARSRSPRAAILAVIATICAAVTLTLTQTLALSPAQAQQVFDQGHVDAFYVTADDGQLHLKLKEDVTGSGVIHDGGDVVLRVNQSAWTDTTEGVAGIGAPTYFLPQTQRADVVWPGWDTQNAGAAGFESVDFHFESVAGPGEVYIFETAGFGDIYPVTNSGALSLGSGEVINQPYPAHRHVNWAFSQPGTYTMTVSAHSNGQASESVTYTWSVGDADAPAPQPQAEGEGGAGEDSPGQAVSPQARDRGSATTSGSGPTPQSAKADKAGQPRGGNQTTKAQAPNQPQARDEAQSPQQQQVAATGHPMLTVGIAILGVGLLVLGLGIARLVASLTERR